MPAETEILDRIEKAGVIAVLVIDDPQDAVPVARALVAGGIDAMELTLRTPLAIDAVRAIAKEVPEMLSGVGTVLTPEQVREVVSAAAAFAVSPGLNPRVVKAAQDAGLFFAPGIATPSDIELASELGCRTMKFFPAEAIGGMSYLRSMAAPYAHLGIRYIPLGGINTANLKDYIQDPLILGVGGSWIAPRKTIKERDWPAITEVAREARMKLLDLRNGEEK